MPPAQTEKKKTPPPLPPSLHGRISFSAKNRLPPKQRCLGRVHVYLFCCLSGGEGGGGFAVWAGACLFFCCLGGGRSHFFAVLAGDGSSLTYRSAWVVFERPNNKKDQTAKKNTGPHAAHEYSSALFNLFLCHALTAVILGAGCLEARPVHASWSKGQRPCITLLF